MNMIKIVCPKCNAEAKLSLVDTTYVGPRRCWKCHDFFTITIENNRVTSCEPLSKEEYERQQEAKKVAEKMRGGIEFSSRQEPATQTSFFKKAAESSGGGIEITQSEEPQIPKTASETRQAAPEKPKQEFFRPNIPHTAPKQNEPDKPGIYPPDKPSTFVPIEDVSVPPVKSPKAKEKAFRPPIPPAT